jgi:peptide-methionine (S)-S-oxide reductase
MHAQKSMLVLLGLVLALSVAIYLRGRLAMSETTKGLAEPAQPPADSASAVTQEPTKSDVVAAPAHPKAGLATATFGGGCFWCTEAVFQRLKGVKSVVSGYSGGTAKNPTYHQVCTGTTGHAEAIQVTYDPALVSFQDLLEVFWKTHDPTTKDRQGSDVGTQYRSVIFYHSDEQKQLAEHYKKKLDESGVYNAPIVTEIAPFTVFYRAEDYHQNFYNQNPQQAYCRMMIPPKLEKLKKLFHDKLKDDTR